MDRLLLTSLAGRPAEIDQFLGAFAGLVPIDQYLAPGNVLRIIGVPGLLRLAGAGARHALRRRADPIPDNKYVIMRHARS